MYQMYDIVHIATKLYDNYDTLMNIIYDRAPGGGQLHLQTAIYVCTHVD